MLNFRQDFLHEEDINEGNNLSERANTVPWLKENRPGAPYRKIRDAGEVTRESTQVPADQTTGVEDQCTCFLCQRCYTRSSLHFALRLPVQTVSILSGLWPLRWKWISLMFAITGLAINAYVFLGNIFAWQVCGHISNQTSTALSPWLCYGHVAYDKSKVKWAGLLSPVAFTRSLFSFSQFTGYLLMFYCNKVLRKDKHPLNLKAAATFLTTRQWISVNGQMLLYFCIWMTFQLFAIIFLPGKYLPTERKVTWLVVENAVLWLYIGTPCWIFAVITHALESVTMETLHEIKSLSVGTLNDVIEIHQQLCNHVFTTVHALRFWFVMHWASFGMTFVMDIVLGFKVVGRFKDTPEFTPWLFSIVFLLLSVYPFLYPCIRAAALTNTCEDILERLNYFSQSDWPREHPLRDRRVMNEFLVYANQVRCGFRIGRLRFDNGLAWVSMFFGLCGFSVKLL